MDLRPGDIVIPKAFLEMPRWWREGTAWLDALPEAVVAACRRWRLRITGDLLHGSNAIVVPVHRDQELLALRLTPPGPEVADQVAALRFWDGRGTVRLVAADLEAGAMLLERLAVDGSLRDVPIEEALPVLGAMMCRLAVPAPPEALSTGRVAADRAATLPAEWARLNGPFDETFLRQAIEAATRLTDPAVDPAAGPAVDPAVDGDLHSGQILRGTREEWLTVDPVLLRGDIAFDLGRMLWTRLDELPTAAAIRRGFDAVVTAAELDRDRACDWVAFRTVDYWLWGLSNGLTEDPARCDRLIRAFAS
jgi:streptomycin 6-kinase